MFALSKMTKNVVICSVLLDKISTSVSCRIRNLGCKKTFFSTKKNSIARF